MVDPGDCIVFVWLYGLCIVVFGDFILDGEWSIDCGLVGWKLLVLEIVTWSNNYLLKIISDLKPYNGLQTIGVR